MLELSDYQNSPKSQPFWKQIFRRKIKFFDWEVDERMTLYRKIKFANWVLKFGVAGFQWVKSFVSLLTTFLRILRFSRENERRNCLEGWIWISRSFNVRSTFWIFRAIDVLIHGTKSILYITKSPEKHGFFDWDVGIGKNACRYGEIKGVWESRWINTGSTNWKNFRSIRFPLHRGKMTIFHSSFRWKFSAFYWDFEYVTKPCSYWEAKVSN